MWFDVTYKKESKGKSETASVSFYFMKVKDVNSATVCLFWCVAIDLKRMSLLLFFIIIQRQQVQKDKKYVSS